MSDLSLKRLLLPTILFLAATTAFASYPSARYETHMAYEAVSHRTILFGGITATDTGTKLAYYLGDTWAWNGSRWVQLFPTHAPSGRGGQAMVYDSNRNHVVLFGGRATSVDMNDTWYFNGTDWIPINTPDAPPARLLAGAAYDPLRDRIVMFGGAETSSDGKSSTAAYDTWEFDGTTWRQIGGEGPHVGKPMLVYDEQHDQVYMLGIDEKANTLMYAYNAEHGVWAQLKPATLPACANEGSLVYEASKGASLYTGGVCTNSTADNETLEWDGSTWNKADLKTNVLRLFAGGAAYDVSRDLTVLFGGTSVVGTPQSSTYLYVQSELTWISPVDTTVPGPRSLFTFTADPVNNTIWLYGGVNETDTVLADFWQFQNGLWLPVTAESGPSSCSTPNAAFDTNRQKLVVVCEASSTFEWDGTAWKQPELKTLPPARRFSSMAYDPNLKKVVLFGGFDTGSNYLDETWLWDGTSWTREKRNPAPARDLAAMWYDPNLKKTVIYGGLGRITSQDRITRYSDTWSFDGSGWSELKPASGTPGSRYGAQVMVDPNTNHTLLFGGVRVDSVPAVPPATIPTEVQVYADDMWEWDGGAWKRMTTDGIPPARENGAMVFDPTLNVVVLYGGYAGHFLSDMWTFNGSAWRVRAESPGGRRRAVVGH